MEQMRAENVVVEEHVTFWLFLLPMLLVNIIFAFILLVQLTSGPVGSKPAPDWVLLLFIALFSLLTLAFWRYSVLVTPEFIYVGFPAYHVTIRWSDVCSIERVKDLPRYAGYGVRTFRYRGKWVKAFNIPEMERLLLEMHGGKDLIISVMDADPILVYARQRMEIVGKNCGKL